MQCTLAIPAELYCRVLAGDCVLGATLDVVGCRVSCWRGQTCKLTAAQPCHHRYCSHGARTRGWGWEACMGCPGHIKDWEWQGRPWLPHSGCSPECSPAQQFFPTSGQRKLSCRCCEERSIIVGQSSFDWSDFHNTLCKHLPPIAGWAALGQVSEPTHPPGLCLLW